MRTGVCNLRPHRRGSERRRAHPTRSGSFNWQTRRGHGGMIGSELMKPNMRSGILIVFWDEQIWLTGLAPPATRRRRCATLPVATAGTSVGLAYGHSLSWNSIFKRARLLRIRQAQGTKRHSDVFIDSTSSNARHRVPAIPLQALSGLVNRGPDT